MSEKKGSQISTLKLNIKQNRAALDQARQALKDGFKLIMLISSIVDEILKAYRLP
jgi:hypothetical protein